MNDFSPRKLATIVGLGIGLALGLLYTWVIDPVELVNTYPALMRTDYRQGWVRLVALAYVADGDLERARVRLDGIKQGDMADALQVLIEEYAAAGRPAETLRSLTTLAKALDVHTPAMLVYRHIPTSVPQSPFGRSTLTPGVPPTPSPTLPPTPTQTSTPYIVPSLAPPGSSPTLSTSAPDDASPLITPTPEPSSTPPLPTPTPPLLARLQLTQKEQVCELGRTPQVQVVVTNERGAGVSGVEVWLMWSGGADRAVTGLKPANGAGYADFGVEPGESYVLGIGELGMPLVTDLEVEPCIREDVEEALLGSWRIVLGPRPLGTREAEGDDRG